MSPPRVEGEEERRQQLTERRQRLEVNPACAGKEERVVEDRSERRVVPFRCAVRTDGEQQRLRRARGRLVVMEGEAGALDLERDPLDPLVEQKPVLRPGRVKAWGAAGRRSRRDAPASGGAAVGETGGRASAAPATWRNCATCRLCARRRASASTTSAPRRSGQRRREPGRAAQASARRRRDHRRASRRRRVRCRSPPRQQR